VKKTVYLNKEGKIVTPDEADYMMEAEYDDKTGERISEKYGFISREKVTEAQASKTQTEKMEEKING